MEETQLYRTMVSIRSFELKLYELSKRALLRGSVHFCVGQEAVAAGVMAALRPTDYITSNHRGHGHAIAKGFQFPGMFAELMGKSTGYSKGKGGSMHIADLSLGHLGANGIVGGGLPIAVGAALGFVQLGQPHVVAAFFGDGAANEGTFHESLNLAALWKLPVVFVLENNQFGMTTALADASAEPDLVKRAPGYGMPGVAVDGMDVRAVQAATAEAVARARSGGGPSLLVLDSWRYEGHYIGDPLVYRTKEANEAWKDRDPIKREAAYLIEHGLASQADLDAIGASVDREIEEAVTFAVNSPEPDDAELFTDVYSE